MKTDSIREKSLAFRREHWLLALATLGALGIRLFRLDHRGMWTDEFHTLNATLLPWKELIIERLRAGHLPTYFLFMKVWTHLFGTSDWVLRLPSAIAGALIVPAAYYYARPWFASRLVWVLVAVASVNGTAVWASQEARMYSMLLVAATFSHGAFLRAIVRREQGAWITYWISAFVATAVQPVMILTIVAHGLYLLACHRRSAWPVLRKWLAALIVVLPLLLVVALFQQKRNVEFDTQEWLSEAGRNIGIFVKRLGLVAFGVSADTGKWRVLTSLVLFLCLGFAYIQWRKRKLADPAFENSPEAVAVKFATVATTFPVAALFIGSFFLEHIAGNERYLVPVCVPLWTLAIWGCLVPRASRWRDAVVAVATILLAVGLLRHWRDRGLGGREIVHYVNRSALPSDVIVCRATPTMRLMIEHYSRRPLKVCTVPEPDKNRNLDEDSAYGTLLTCLGSRTRFWLVEYRGKGSFLREMIARRPKEFEIVKEKSIEQARAALIYRRSLQ